MKSTRPAAEDSSHSRLLARWCADTSLDAIPHDIAAAAKLRILDTVGLALAGRGFDVGQAILAGTAVEDEKGAASIIGGPDRLPAASAAMANAVLAEAIEFDDSHNETVVHVSSPVVAAALAVAQSTGASGAQLLRAVILGSEVACRVAVGAPGAFHVRGFHPTGIFSTFGAAAAAACLMKLDEAGLVNALGLAGSFASGILESWSDGTWGKLSHPGWSAQAGIWAARAAGGGFTGPGFVLEGPKGLFATHIQDKAVSLSLERISADLGSHWESRAISFKPYPNAHVMHGVQDALLALMREEPIVPADVEEIECTVAPYMVDLVCEPLEAKFLPPGAAQARISLPFTVAEVIVTGSMTAASYSSGSLENPDIAALARKVRYRVNPAWTSRQVYPGAVRISLRSGNVRERMEQANLGSAAKPVSSEDVIRKFTDNAREHWPAERISEVARRILHLEKEDAVRTLAELFA